MRDVQLTMSAIPLPARESFNSFVRVESRYGMCPFRFLGSANIEMQFPKKQDYLRYCGITRCSSNRLLKRPFPSSRNTTALGFNALRLWSRCLTKYKKTFVDIVGFLQRVSLAFSFLRFLGTSEIDEAEFSLFSERSDPVRGVMLDGRRRPSLKLANKGVDR